MVDSPPVTRPARNRTVHIVLWVLQVLVAVFFLIPVYRKLAGEPDSVELFRRIGLGQWLRYAVGLLELTIAVGLVIPRLAGLAALGLVGVMVGATLSEIFVYGGKWLLPLALALVSAVVALGRRDQIRALLPRRSSEPRPASSPPSVR